MGPGESGPCPSAAGYVVSPLRVLSTPASVPFGAGTGNWARSTLRLLRGFRPSPLPSWVVAVSQSELSPLAPVVHGKSRFERNDMYSVKLNRKKPRGGPQSMPADSLRTIEIKVLYTATEHAQACVSAANAGLKIAVFARELTIKKKVIRSTPSPEYVAHYQALAHSTANLNRLTHAINLQLLHGVDLDSVIVNRLEDLTVLLGIIGEDVDKLRSILLNRE